MRVSVNDSTIDFWNYKALLDGVEVKNCVSADEELGEVVCYKTDKTGKFYLSENGETPDRETLKGKVEIIYVGE